MSRSLLFVVVAIVQFFSYGVLAKSEAPEFITHQFPSGEQVVFRTGANGLQGIYHVDRNGKAVLLEERHPFFIGHLGAGQSGQISISSNGVDMKQKYMLLQAPGKIAFAILGADVIVIAASGKHRRISIVPGGTKPYYEMNAFQSFTFLVGGREYLYLGYSVNTRPDAASAILVGEDLNFNSKEVTPDEAKNGTLHVEELLRGMPSSNPLVLSRETAENPKVVSLAYAQGQDGQYRPPADLQVLDNDGKAVSAVDFIKSFSTNLTEKFKKEPLPAAHVNQVKVDEIANALAGYEITSVAYLGYPGTGKTTDINMMISEAANERGPKFLREYTFIALKPGVLEASGKWRGAPDTKMSALLALAKNNKIIYVIDEIHSLKGLGTHSEKAHDLTEMMKDDMAEGTLKVIGMSTDAEFYGAGFSKPFVERFVVVHKEEPRGEELIRMLRGWIVSRKLADPGDAFLLEAQRIADEFAGVGAQPRKTTKLLDGVYSRLKLSGREGATPSLADLHEVAKTRLNFDPALLDPTLARERVERMTRHVDSQIIGQTDARALIERSTIRAFSGLGRNSGPRLKLLLTGLEGQGKTSIAKAYAEGMGLPYQIIDMSQFATGAGSRFGPLAEAAAAVARNAHTVLIFDEIEKCPVVVQEQLLQALESGRAVVQMPSNGGVVSELVDFRNTSVIFTANAGADELRRRSALVGFMRFSSKPDRQILAGGEISRYVLDRIPDVAYIGSLNKIEFRAAVELHLESMFKRFRDQGLRIEFADREKFLDFAASLWRENISNRRIENILRPIDDYLAQQNFLYDDFKDRELVLTFDGSNLRLQGWDSPFSCEGLL